VFWGLNYPILKFGVSQIQPLVFPVIRFSFGGVVLLLVLWAREGSFRVARADLPLLGTVAVLGITLNQACLVFAFANTTASNVALLSATTPLFTALLAALVGLERPGIRHWASTVLGFVGIVFIVAVAPISGGASRPLLGAALALVASFCTAASTIPIRPLMRRYTGLRILTWQMLIGAALLLPIALPSIAIEDFGQIPLSVWGTLGYTAIVTGALTNLLFFAVIDRVGPSRATVFLYLQTALGVAFSAVLLNEHLSAAQLFGGTVVIVSILLGRPTWMSAKATRAVLRLRRTTGSRGQ
jgi:drug/metabolite transporter (DMT)-like permease